MKPYPIFLCNLNDRGCIVIGGDHEAERKVRGLLEVDATVRVIAASVTDELERLAAEGRIEWIRREYREGDLEGAFLVIVSERNPARTEPIWEEANRVGALINAMDDVRHCTFVAGSVVRSGPLVVSISTSGAAPTVAVRLRQEMEARFGTAFGEYLELLGSLRDEMAQHHHDFDKRRRLWYSLADSELYSLIETGQYDAVAELVFRITGIRTTFFQITEEEYA